MNCLGQFFNWFLGQKQILHNSFCPQSQAQQFENMQCCPLLYCKFTTFGKCRCHGMVNVPFEHLSTCDGGNKNLTKNHMLEPQTQSWWYISRIKHSSTSRSNDSRGMCAWPRYQGVSHRTQVYSWGSLWKSNWGCLTSQSLVLTTSLPLFMTEFEYKFGIKIHFWLPRF